MTAKVFLAVDLGASSGRVLAGLFDGEKLELREVHRFPNGPVSVNDRLYWRTFELWHNVLAGLRAAAREFGDSIVSVGVDTWGVDFALVDRNGELLAAPVAYRDSRTHGELDRAFAIVPREEIFAETGVQFMELNTLYQLLAVKRIGSPPLDRAARLLHLPDLFHWMLTGVQANEATIASTSQLFNPHTRTWSDKLIERFGLPRAIFGPIAEPGATLGPLLPHVADETGLKNVSVVLPGSHDTASAVLAVPANNEVPPAPSPWRGWEQPSTGDPKSPERRAVEFAQRPGRGEEPGTRPTTNWAYISSGTWSLMGLETSAPVITDDAFAWNFTNEGGVAGTTRLLKNISGLWLVQECQRIWKSQGHDYDWQTLTDMALEAEPLAAVIDPDDPRLVAPRDMCSQLAALAKESGQPAPQSHGSVVRMALESLSLKYREVLGYLEHLAGGPIDHLHIVGGGSQNRALNQMTADACGRPVLAGPIEATAIGNVLMQAIAVGDIADVSEARKVVRRSFDLAEYHPHEDDRWAEVAARLKDGRP